MRFRDPTKYGATLGEATCSQGKPRNETDPMLLAVIQHVFAAEPPTSARPVLWAALAINAAMLITEIVAGGIAGSVSLYADAVDFLGDSFNYAISLAVIGLALTWRARAAFLKGATMALLGVWVLGEAVWHVMFGRVPEPFIMGGIGTLALAANGLVLSLLYRFRDAEANLRSAWICSRNDVFGNLAVLAAALGVF